MRYERQKATWGALLAITLVAFLLRTSHLNTQSLWRDEVDVIRLANEPLPGSDVGRAFFDYSDGEMHGFLLRLVQRLVRVGYNGPLYFLLMR
jgi:hypothetical protein